MYVLHSLLLKLQHAKCQSDGKEPSIVMKTRKNIAGNTKESALPTVPSTNVSNQNCSQKMSKKPLNTHDKTINKSFRSWVTTDSTAAEFEGSAPSMSK
jgi:hypothetical protein